MRIRFAPLALLSVAAMWGATFVMMKDVIKRQDVSSFLFTRFLIAAVAMLLIRPTVIKRFTRELVWKGAISGTFLGSGFLFQTFGLARTSAAITGFITGLYVVATPLIAGVVLKQKISRRIWGCVFIATIGLGLLSIHGWTLGVGEGLLLLCAISFASHIICLAKWSDGLETYAFTSIQILTATVLFGISSVAQGFQTPPDKKVWEVAIFCGIFATVFAFFIQTWSQARMTATKVAVILTMEVVFAAIFAVIFGHETITLRLALGGALVVLAMSIIVLQDA